jgi:fatty-acyl-CoA synthase
VQAPKSVDFVESIPQTPVGKPDKKALRALYA